MYAYVKEELVELGKRLDKLRDERHKTLHPSKVDKDRILSALAWCENAIRDTYDDIDTVTKRNR